MLRRALLVLLWSGLAAALPAKSPAQPALSPTAQAGRAIYFANCVGCHGLNVQGGLAPNIRRAGQGSLASFKRAVLQGKGLDGRPLALTMPRYTRGFRPHLGRQPTDTELRNLQSFLKTVK
ncbi:c-type cytochrome [Deinococcus fonticola]|uniref:c-type cytochrome n=1 Tax=Deinococcus fonticola TaxID=2528713 RepID=UPI0010754BC0|nr:cytochrome c [Deinococcus fonticola]